MDAPSCALREAHARCTFDAVPFGEKYKTCDSNDIAGSQLQTRIEESILASGVLSVGHTLLEQVTVIFSTPTGADKRHPLLVLHRMSAWRDVSPQGEAACQPVASQRCLLLLQHLH